MVVGIKGCEGVKSVILSVVHKQVLYCFLRVLFCGADCVVPHVQNSCRLSLTGGFLVDLHRSEDLLELIWSLLCVHAEQCLVSRLFSPKKWIFPC